MENELLEFDSKSLRDVLLKSQGLGFLSPQPIENQISHAVDFLTLFEKGGGKILDLGAGGGLPCLVWLHLDETIQIHALDAMKKRCDFLEEVRQLNPAITNRLKVVNGRAEGLAKDSDLRESFDIVVARGFGAPSVTAECASGFLKMGGHLIVSGRPENEEQRWNRNALKELSLELKDVKSGNQSHAVIIEKVGELNSIYPRSAKALKTKPLW